MKSRRRSTMSALAVTLALVAGACGDDADDAAVATTAATTAVTTAVTTPAVATPAATTPATEPAATTAATEPSTTPETTADATPETSPETTVETGGDASLAGTTLTLYSGRNEELTQGVVDAFEAATGVTVEVRYGSSAEMGAALLEEGTSTPADVFYSQEVGAVGVLARADLLSPLPDEVVALADERFRPPAENRWVGVTGRSRVIVYNPDLVPEPPTGVLELTDPKWAGQVAIVPGNAGFQAFITGFRVSQGDDAARQWLTDMIANGVRIDIESNGDVLAAVNDGDQPLGLINHYYWGALAEEVGEENMTAQLVFPKGDDPGGLFNATAVGITQGGADNPAALAFVEFLLSEEGQTFFVEQTFEYPVVAGIPGPVGYPDKGDLEGPAIDLTDLDSLEATQAMLTELGLLG